MNRRGAASADSGYATVWAVAAIAVLAAVLLVGLQFGAAVVGRHRAQAAADLAALAAAVHVAEGTAAACERARAVAAGMGAGLRSCALDGWDALVEAEVAVQIVVLGPRSAIARARAGPAFADGTGGPR